MNFLASLASTILPGLFSVVDKVVPNPAQNAQLKAQLQEAFLAADETTIKAQAGIITAEAQSPSWLTCNWRPLTMMVFTTIIACNYIVFPIARMFHAQLVDLPIPTDLWDLLKLGLGGYIAGRSVEKAIASWKGTA